MAMDSSITGHTKEIYTREIQISYLGLFVDGIGLVPAGPLLVKSVLSQRHADLLQLRVVADHTWEGKIVEKRKTSRGKKLS